MSDIKIGDTVALKHGPFSSLWRAVGETERGMTFEWTGHVVFAGFDFPTTAPDGTKLTDDLTSTFVGAAHLHDLWQPGIEAKGALNVSHAIGQHAIKVPGCTSCQEGG